MSETCVNDMLSTIPCTCMSCQLVDALNRIAALEAELEQYRGIAITEGAEKALADYKALEAENERLVGHIDLMVDEFKRIKAIHYEKTAHNLEVTGLCERAITNTHQHVPVIKQRDDAEERAILAKAAGKREAAEEIVEIIKANSYKDDSFDCDSGMWADPTEIIAAVNEYLTKGGGE